MTRYGAEIEQLARRVLGTPNKRLSNDCELRFGRNGSISVMIAGPKAGSWYDHEHKVGGGINELHEQYGERAEPEPPPRQNVTRYAYRDEAGELLFWACRIGQGKGKRFWQEQPGPGKGGILRDPHGKPTMQGARLVPYRLPDIVEARRNCNGHAPRVYVVEGEKDCDRLVNWGLVATTNPGGAGKWRSEFSNHLAGCEIVIIPDNDDAGRAHAEQIARSVTPHAASVCIVNLGGLGEKGDISDWIDAGGDQGTLEDIIDSTPPWTPPEGSISAGRILTGTHFIASFVVPDWLIDGIVQRGRLYACTSLTGHGKTAGWLYNACMIHAGRKVGHLEVEPGNVLILAGENPEDLKARMLGMRRAFNLTPKQLPYVLPATFPLTEEEAEVLRRDIAALRVPLALIIGDTAASFFPGDDENDNVQAGQYARTLRTLTTCDGNPAVVALCHPVKNAGRDNLLPRGGSAFLNELDGNLTLWSDQVGETTTLHWKGKIRGPDFDVLTYRLKPVETGHKDKKGRDVITIVAQPIDDIEAAHQAAQTIANEDAVLQRLHIDPKASLADIARTLGWIKYDDENPDDKGKPERWRVQRACERLEKERLVTKSRGKYRLTPVGAKVLEEA